MTTDFPALPDDGLDTVTGPDGPVPVFFCPDCGRLNEPEALVERGVCFASDCGWTVPEETTG